MRRLPIAALAFAALAILAASAASGAAWESPEFAAATMRPKRIAIMPAQAEMVRTRVNDALPFVKETRALEDAMRRETAAGLTALGYEADLASLAPEKIASDRGLQAIVRQLEGQVSGIVDVAAGKPRDIGRGRFSVGEAVLPLASATGADAFLWLQSRSVVPSKGQRTLGGIFSVLAGTYAVPSNQTQLIAWLVDARTGDLASVAVASAGGAVLKEPEAVAAKVVKQLLAQWPSHATARRVSAKRIAADQGAVKPEIPLEGRSVTELDAIARFEEAAAKLEGGASAGLPEEIAARDEFTESGAPIAAEGAAPAEPVSLFEQQPASPAPAPGPSPAFSQPPPPPSAPPPRSAPAPPASPAPPAADSPSGLPSPKVAWSAPAAIPSRRVSMQMIPDANGIVVRNADAGDVLASVDLGAWTPIAAGTEQAFDAGPGSHRILIASPEGRELVRASVLISSSQARIEVTR